MKRQLNPKRKPVTFEDWWNRYFTAPKYGLENWDYAQRAWSAAMREAKRREKAKSK